MLEPAPSSYVHTILSKFRLFLEVLELSQSGILGSKQITLASKPGDLPVRLDLKMRWSEPVY